MKTKSLLTLGQGLKIGDIYKSYEVLVILEKLPKMPGTRRKKHPKKKKTSNTGEEAVRSTYRDLLCHIPDDAGMYRANQTLKKQTCVKMEMFLFVWQSANPFL